MLTNPVRWLAAVGAGAVLCVTSCLTTSLEPPRHPEDPRAVFLVDHGRHSSVVIATDSGDLVRYAYGDWRYYADQDTSLRSGARALFWPTAGALARGELAGPPDALVLRGQLRVGVEDIYALDVAGVDADRVRGQLDDLHERGIGEHQYVAAYDMVFSPHPEPYTWANNSATMIARWLDDLGVNVEGWAVVALWEVVGPAGEITSR